MSVRGTVCVSGGGGRVGGGGWGGGACRGGVSGGGGEVSPANDGHSQPESHRADLGPGIVVGLRYGKFYLP